MSGMPEPGCCQYGKACFNIKGCTNRHPVEEICVLVDTCNEYHCNKRHNKQRPRPCNFGLKCKKNGSCQFLHPTDHRAGSSSGNNNGQLATVKSTAAPVKPTTKMLKFTGFGHQIDDFTVAGQKLQAALRSLGDQEVCVNIPSAGISQSCVVGFAYFSSTGFAEAAAQHFKSVAASLELGDLRAELHFGEKMQQGNAPASTPPLAQAKLANAHAPPAGVHAQPVSRPSLVQGSPNAQGNEARVVDGVKQLYALPHHPALGEIWDKRIIPVLTGHQDKVDEARKELEDLSEDSSQLHASDLKQAKDAITRVQEELTQQLKVFLEYVGRILKAGLDVPRTRAALAREVYRLESALPALAVRPEFEKAVRAGQFIVVKGETGSGKSTQLPQYLADMRGIDGQIIVTQPRKIAAQELAGRVAFEYAAGNQHHAKQAGVVGFHVGGHRAFNEHTCRIKYMTEAVLLNEMLNGADLGRYAAIIVDEAHERSINTDVLLGLLKRDAPDKYKKLKVCVTSATIETALFRDFFGEAACLEIPGRMFPVTVRHVSIPDAQNLAVPAVSAVLRILDETAAEKQSDGPAQQYRGGDVLVFLTGQDDVGNAKKILKDKLENPDLPQYAHFRDHVIPMTLYSQQKPQLTKDAVAKGRPDKRRVVFSTNVAETSLTIDGVTVVVDAGFTKESLYDHQKRMKILQTFRITQSSAKQRQGRAGRTAPGVCYRLYSEQDMRAMQPSQTAEILRSPLELTVLNLRQLGIDAQNFCWLEAPDKELLDRAVQQLKYLQALEPVGDELKLTSFGKLVIALQVDPQICRIVHFGLEKKMGFTAVALAALLTTGMQMFFHRKNADQQSKDLANKKKAEIMDPEGGDVVTALKVFNKWMAIGSGSQHNGSQTNTPGSSRPGSAGSAAHANDSASENGSEYSTASTAYGGNFTPQGTFAARRWCEEYCVNSKTLGIAKAARMDILRQLAAASIAVDGSNDAGCTAEDINKMFVAGFFQNLASRRGSDRSFMAAESQQVGKIHMGSALQEVNNDRLPHWMAFVELFRSTQVFLTNVVPCDPEWLAELAPLYHQERWQVLKETAMEQRVIGNLSRAMICSLVSKQQSKLIALERQLKASVGIDYRDEVLTLWALPQDIDAAVQQVEDLCEAYRSTLLKESHEIHKQGSTRVAYGAGCAVKHLLLGKEFVRMNVEFLPRDFTDQKLVDLIVEQHPAAQGQIASAAVEGHPHSSNKWAHVQFEQPEHAAAVLQKLDSYMLAGRSLTAKPAGTHNPNQSNMMDAKLVLFWNTGVSTGVGYVQFATAQSANDAISHTDERPLNGQVLKVKAKPKFKMNKQSELEMELDAEGRYTGKIVGEAEGKAARFQVIVSDLPLSVDEVMLREHFQGFGNVASVNIGRKESTSKPDDEEAEQQAMLRSLMPHSIGFPVQTALSMPNNNFRSGFVVHYENVAQTKLAAAHFRAQAGMHPDGYSYMGQPVRAQPDYTYTVSFHRAIYDSRQAEYAAVQIWCTAHGVRCVVKDLPGAQPRKLFRLTCSDEDYLQDARRQLDRLLRCSILKRDELFSQYGRVKIQDAERTARGAGHSSLYVHWDNSTRQIRVYGTQADKDHLVEELTKAADELAKLQKVEIHVPPKRKRACYQELPKLNSIAGVMSVQMLGDVLVARCTDEAQERLRKMIDDLVGRTVKPYRRSHGTCCVCCDTLEETFTLQACGCKGCTDCLKPMLISAAASTVSFPLTCPAMGCGKPIIMRDIISLADPDDLEKIMMQSLAQYKTHHAEVFECQAIECQQVGRVRDEEDDKQWHCDVCLATYCVPCQEVLKESVPRHSGMSCQQYQEAIKAARDSSQYDLASMGSVICLCPGCNAYTIKSSGCLHMHCTQCDTHFCWGCGHAFGKGAQHTTYNHTTIMECTGPRAHEGN